MQKQTRAGADASRCKRDTQICTCQMAAPALSWDELELTAAVAVALLRVKFANQAQATMKCMEMGAYT